MNRAFAVVVTCLVVLSSVVPASALAYGAPDPVLDAGDRTTPESLDTVVDPNPPAPDVSRSTTSTSSTASASGVVATSSGKTGNTGFEDHYLYLAGLVNAANGNLYLERTDLGTRARGGDIALVRSYNSLRSGEHGPFGFGWTHSFAMRLEERPGGTVVFLDGDGSAHTFEPDGSGGYTAPAGLHARLRATGGGFELDRTDGQTLRFDADGTLQWLEDRNGNRLTMSYEGGNLTTVADDAGQNLSFTYTPEGRIETVTDPLGRTVEYEYVLGDLVSVTDPMGRETTYEYYANHKLAERDSMREGPLSVDYYDGTDRVRCLSPRADCTESGTVLGYDVANSTATALDVLGSDRTTVEYNAAGNPVSVTTPDGSASVVWDAEMNPVEVRNRTGTYTFDYDAYGNPVEFTGPNGTRTETWETVDTTDRYLSLLRSRTDRRGRTTTFTYDADGNRLTETDPAGRTRETRYNDWGYPTAETDFGGHETTYTYDTRGFRTEVTDPTGRTTEFEYDAIGRRVAETNAAGNTYRFTYDADGNLLTRTDPLGNTVEATYDERGIMLEVRDERRRTIDIRDRPTVAAGDIETDDRGRAVSATGSDGRVTVSREFAPGRVEALDFDFGTFDRRIDYHYDAFERLAAVEGPGGNITYEYDDLDRVTRLVGPDGESVEYTYDAAGRKVRATYSNGVVTNYTYDDAGRLLRVRVVGPAQSTQSTTTSVDTANTTTTATATETETETATSAATGTPTQSNTTTTASSTATATETTTTTASSTATATETTTTTASSTATATETTTTTATETTTTTASSTTTPEPTDATLDSSSTDLTASAAAAAGTELLNLTYAYDDAGNVASVTDGNGSVTTYGYDALNQLVSVDYPTGKTVEYAYDAAGNRVSRTVNGTEEPYSYGFSNQLREAGSTAYAYDDDGNRVLKSEGGENTTYEYGPGGRLDAVVRPDGDRIEFSYLPSGERLSKTTPEGTTYYAYVGSDVAAEFDANGTLVRRYTHEPGVDRPLAVTEGGDLSFFHQDAGKNVRAVTAANGSLLDTYDYEPFGESVGATPSPYGFAARRYDAETGLYYNRMRYYDPATGVFTREDPLGISAGTNFYRYASNNPLRNTDPTGLLDWWTGGCANAGTEIGSIDLKFVKTGSCTGGLQNSESGQSCGIEASVTDVGAWAEASVGSAGVQGSQIATQGPACGEGLAGTTLYCLGPQGDIEAAGGVTGGIGGCISQGGLASGFQANEGAGVSGGAGVGIGLVRIITIDSVDCDCVLIEDPKYAGCECEDDDDDRPPGDDHPDDNHDLSVLGYDGVYPAFEYDRGSSMAVLDRGFVDELEDFLRYRKIDAASVDVRTSEEDLARYDVLVIPTGGLLGLNSLASFEAKLDAYVRDGGTLVVFPQQRGYEFGPVPGNLKGYGWLEDQSCQYNSIGVTNACAVVSSVGSETASVNVDGYFTDWPANSTVLLSRTVNGQPAMLTYGRGQGRVLASTVYTDWAYGHHAASDQGEALLVNVLDWATSPPDVPTYRPGENVTSTVNVTNYGELAVDEVRVKLESPNGITEFVPSTRTPVAGFSNVTLDATYDAPSRSLGIWTVGYVLLNDSYGAVQRVDDAGRIAVSAFDEGEGLFASENVTFAVSSDAERYADGGNATFRITIRNSGSENETVTAWWAYPHNYWREPSPIYGAGTTRPGEVSALNETVVVPAGEEIEIVDEIPVYSYDRLWAQFYRGDRNSTDYLGRASRAFFSFRPEVETDVDIAETEYRLGEQVDVSLRLAGNGGEARTEVRVLGPESTLVFENETVTNFAVNNSSTYDFQFDLPTNAPAGFYTAVAEPEVGGEKVGFDSAQFFVPDSRIRAIPGVPASVANGSQVSFTLVNAGQEDSRTDLDASLVAPDGTTVWSQSNTVDVPATDRVTVPFTVEVGPRQFGEYTLIYTVTPEREDPFTRRYTLSSSLVSTVAFDRPSYAVRDDLRAAVTLTNDGGLGGELPVEVSVPDAGYVDTSRLTVASGENATVEHVVPLPTDIGAGEHQVRVTLGRADPSTRTFSFVVPASSLETELVSAGPFEPGENVTLELTNTGGVDTNASCALVVTGPRGVRVDERTVRTSVLAGGTATVDASLPEQVISGTYFLGSTCEDFEIGETVSSTETFAVEGLDASLSLSTDKEVYGSGENVTVTVPIDNRGDAVDNGTLTVEVTDSSPDAGTSSTTSGVSNVDPTTATSLPVSGRSTVLSTVTGVDATRPTGLAEETRFTSASLVDGTPPSRLAAGTTATAVSLAGARNITGNLTVTNATEWRDEVVVVDGHLSVASGGNLTLVNTSLFFDTDSGPDAGLEVEDGGTFRLLAGSTLDAAERYDEPYARSLAGSTVELRDSRVENIGDGFGDFWTERGFVVRTDDATVENVTFVGNVYALVLYNVTGITVRDSDFSENSYAVRVRESNDITLVSNRFDDDSVDVGTSDGVSVTANRFLDRDLTVQSSSNVSVADNSFTYGGSTANWAIEVTSSELVDVENNTIGTRGGIELRSSTRSVIANNTIDAGVAVGIAIQDADGNEIRGNEVHNGSTSIRNSRSANTTLAGNTLLGNDETVDGIALDRSTNVTLRGNTLTRANLSVDTWAGTGVTDYLHDIDTSNVVHGGPVYYWLNRSDATVPSDAGVAYLVNASNVTVAGTARGSVAAVFSRDVTVRDGTVSNATNGLYLSHSNGTTISNLTARDNEYGLLIDMSNTTNVRDSTLTDNGVGLRAIGDYENEPVGLDVRRTVVRNSSDPNLFVRYVRGVVVVDNTISDGESEGISVASSPNLTIEANRFEGNLDDAVLVTNTDTATISNNRLDGNRWGISLGGTGTVGLGGQGGSVVGNELTDTRYDAISISGTVRANVSRNRITNAGGDGITVDDSENDTVARNVLVNTSDSGILVRDAQGLLVTGNELRDTGEDRFGRFEPAISLTGARSYYSDTDDVTVVDNRIEEMNWTAIELNRVDGITLDGNDVGNASVGISMVDAFGTAVRNHTLNESELRVSARELRYYVHDVDTSNTIRGRPVYYLLNRTDTTVDARAAGSLWLVNASDVTSVGGGAATVVRSRNVTVDSVVSAGRERGLYLEGTTNVTVHNATIRNGTHGVLIVESTLATVRNSTVSGTTYGVLLEDDRPGTNNTSVVNNDLSGNEYGVFVREVADNEVRDNRLSGNGYAVYLSRSERTTVRGNVVEDNQYGIYLYTAAGSLVYDNYLDNPTGANAVESYTNYYDEPNRWNVTKTPGENVLGGPFLGGNYYHDYTGEDLDGDGLGDTDLGTYGFDEGDFHPLVPPVDRGPVVWSGNFTVDLAEATADTVTVTVPGSLLSGSSGKLKLSARLTSTSTQTVAFEDPPFYVLDGDTVLTLDPDARQYQPGETVTLSGRLENRGSTATTYDLSVEANGTEALAETVTLAAGESDTYETTVTATSTGTLPLQASAGGVVVEDRVDVIAPQVSARIDAPDTVGRAPFETALEVENTGRIDATVDVSFLGTNESLTLAPNETRLFVETTSVTGDTTLEATIDGDVTRTVTRDVTFGEGATLTVSPATVYPEGTLAVPYAVDNTGSLETEFDANFTLDGRTRTRTVYLPAGGSTNGSLVFDLSAGEYALAYETPFENGSTTVRVAERNQVALVAETAGNVSNGTLAVNVTLANTGPNDVEGEIRINSSSFDSTAEFAVAAGETLNRTVNVTVPEGTPPGTRNLTVEAYTEGERLGRVTDRFDVLGSRIELVSGPGTKRYGLGETARLNVTLVNSGNAEGPVVLNLTVPGIHEEDQRLFLAPDERRVVPVTFLVPEDLAAGTYPVEYRLDDGPVRESELVVEGMNVSVSATLNESLYEEGDTARLALDVTNEGSFPATLFSRVQYNGYDEVRQFDLAADGTTTVAFDVPVRNGTDRKVFYSVYAGSGRSLHIDGAYLHRADPNVTLYTDGQVYAIGETVTVTAEPSTTGQLDVYAPNFTYSEEVSGSQSLTFTVPELRSGSYNVVYAFENTTRSYPFDVDGYTARVLESSLDSTAYTGGDDLGLSLDVEAARAVPVTVTARVYGEGSTPLTETNTTTTLSAGRNTVTVVGSLPANASGVHSVVYTVDAALSTPIRLATGSEYFDVAAATGTNAAPVAAFEYTPADPTTGDEVAFDADGSTDADGTLSSFEWDFDGDLAFDATGERVTHTFDTPGDYTVTLRVTDDGGLSNVTSRTVSVAASPTPTPTPTPTPGGDGGGGQPAPAPPGEVELVDATLLADRVTTGTAVTVEVSLANYDLGAGSIDLSLTADGTVVAERTVSVGVSSRRTVTVDHRFDTSGTYALAVNGVPVGTVTVDPSPSTPTATTGPTARPTTATPSSATPTDSAGTTTTPADGSGSDTPTARPDSEPGQSGTSPSPGTPADGSGFTVLLALLALGFVALLARRQRP